VLWVAFAVVHVGIAVLGYVLPNDPMGDIGNVYDPWSRAALAGHIVGIHEQWVYPQLALVPMVLAQLIAWAGGYFVAWAIVAVAVDAVGFAVLIGRGRSRARIIAAWYWLAFLLLLGPVALYRIDAITVPLAIMGGLWLVGRPWLGATLLAIATWVKVWPAALLAAAFVVLRRRWAVLGAAAAVSAVVVIAVAAAGGLSHLLGFIGDQAGRGLQIEAPVSGVYLWLAAFGAADAWIYYDSHMLTFQATGPQVDAVIAVMTPLLAIALLAILLLGAIKSWRGASFAAVFPALALSLVTALIVVNKVGSPQFYLWIIAPLVLGLVLDRARWWRIAILGLVVAGLTQLVYPILYSGLMTVPNPEVDAVLALTIRNAGAVALFAWSLVKLARVRAPHPVTARQRSAPRAVPAE
jgi:hypothetical protein